MATGSSEESTSASCLGTGHFPEHVVRITHEDGAERSSRTAASLEHPDRDQVGAEAEHANQYQNEEPTAQSLWFGLLEIPASSWVESCSAFRASIEFKLVDSVFAELAANGLASIVIKNQSECLRLIDSRVVVRKHHTETEA
jgi:hypothetical protein